MPDPRRTTIQTAPRIRRNDALDFAQLTRENLDTIREHVGRNKRAHAVTQLTNSLLGLIVFPWEEEQVQRTLADRPLSALGPQQWRITKGASKSTKLGQLIRHIRNAAAHGNMTFSSDDPDMGNVTIVARDYQVDQHGKPAAEPCWEASIRASDLDDFCRALIRLLEHTLE